MSSYIVTGLAFGDEGKGSWVDHLCRLHNIKTAVRFNGGAQALHHVTTDTGVVHGFSQFGSHSFIPGAKTLLSRFMLIEPLTLLKEAEELEKKGVSAPLRSLFVSEQAPIIPYTNVLLNRIMESFRGQDRHGSCGLGIGLTQQDVEELGDGALRAGDLVGSEEMLKEKLMLLYERVVDQSISWENSDSAADVAELRKFSVESYVSTLVNFAKRVRIIPEAAFLSIIRRGNCVFEGAQGALLDQYQGFFPHCTRSTTTSANAETLLREAGYGGVVEKHGLLRAYGTRHGAGPFVTEEELPISSCDNSTGEWQGVFRHGWFDAVAARFAIGFSEVDGIVLTNLDRLDGMSALKIATAYNRVDSNFYDQDSDVIRLVNDYETSRKRTAAMFDAVPVYKSFPGWNNAEDAAHESYVRSIEVLIEKPALALSRRKDSQKIYC